MFCRGSRLYLYPRLSEFFDEKIQALEAGQIDMLLATASNDIPDTVLLSVLDASPFYFTVKAGNTELLNEINRGMQLLITSEPELVAETARKALWATTLTHLH